jgi:hypothetical protein
MRSKALKSLLLVALMSVASGIAMAQTVTKQIKVTFPQRVVIAEQTLEPGEYMFKEVSDKLVQVFDNDQMAAEAAVITIDTENKQPSEETKVVLFRVAGNDEYYIDKIWVQGRSTGYEFPVPEKVKSLERERVESIAGMYEEKKDDSQGLK